MLRGHVGCVCVGGGGERSCQKRQGTCNYYITSIAKLHKTLASQIVKTIISLLLATKYTQLCV